MQGWGPECSADLAGLVEAALPGEGLTADELLACCWEDPGIVLGTAGGDGAVAAVRRERPDGVVGFVRLLAVHPGSRRRGLGRALLAAAEGWLADQGATRVALGGSAPFYLWPGVDVGHVGALCLAEAAGYRPVGAELNLSCPTTHRAAPPPGVELRRLLDDEDATAATSLAAARWPWWVPELERAVEHATAFGAFDGEDPVGFACHSVNRTGWVGPMATEERHRGGGIGAALLGSLCRDLTVAGHRDAEIAWVGPVGFYVRTAGAAVSRVFRTYERRLDAR